MKPLITIICLLGSFATMMFAIWPDYQELRSLIAEAESKEEDLNNIISYSQNIDEMVEALNGKYRNDFQKLKDGVPADHYVPSLLSKIKETSYKTGIRVNKIGDFEQANFEEINEIKKIEINLELEGPYNNFKNFIFNLKRSARVIGFESLTIRKKKESKEDEILEYNLKLITYSY